MRPPRLLARFERDSPPTLQALSGRAIQSAFAADALDWENLRGPQFSRFLDHQFEPIELDQRRAQRDANPLRLGRQLLDGAEDYLLFASGLDFREIRMRVIGDLVALPHFNAQHPRQMARVLSCHLRIPLAYLVDKESP